jgi:tripartite ATP-independent transporter DctP family solute receptor
MSQTEWADQLSFYDGSQQSQLEGFMKVRRILAIAVWALFCVVGTASAEKTIKVGHAVPETDAMHLAWTFFKEKVEANTGGSLKVEIYPNAALGNDRELSEAVMLGEVTCTSVSSSPLAAFVPDLFILDVPFSFPTRDSVWAALDGELGKALDKSMEKKGIINLGYWENGFRNITNNKRPIRTPKDLEGVKLRTMENPIHLAAWKALGANPTPMSFGEVFTALQQGTVDGQENPYALIYNCKFFEVQKYISDTRHIFTAYVPMINKEFLDDLSNKERTAVLEAGREMSLYQRKIAVDLDEKARQNILASGIQAADLTPEERQGFRVAIEPALAMAQERVSPEVIDVYRRTVLGK